MAKPKEVNFTRAEVAAFRRRYDWMLAPIRSLRRNPWPLFREPTTYMARVREKMEREFKHRLAQVGEEQFVRDLIGVGIPRSVLLDGFARAADHLREEEGAVAQMPAGTGLLGLMGAADARIRNSPLILFLNLKLMLGVNKIGPMGQLHRALKERGEARGRLLLRAVADISEQVYRPYLVEVWNLTELAEGRLPARPGRFGGLVGKLEARLGGVEDVIEPLALRVRNAVDHDHVEYVHKKRSFILWNDSDGWRDEVTVDDLKVMADWFLAVAGKTFPSAAHWFMQNALLRSGLFSAIFRALPAIEKSDEVEMERIGREIEARTQSMYEEVARLFASSTSGGEHLADAIKESERWLRPDAAGQARLTPRGGK